VLQPETPATGRRSPWTVAETVDRLVAAVEQREITVFARIDHAAGARAAGLDLPDEEVLVFGNPKAGTPLLQADPRIGLDLPLRVLVWDDGGTTHVLPQDVVSLGQTYALGESAAALATLAAVLDALVSEAVGS
jgi:uncharacterized protein (DUF302 family)